MKSSNTFASKNMERSFRIVAVFLLAASLFSCNFSKVEDFTLGKDFVKSTSGVIMIDTMSIVASTVHLDSIVTTRLPHLLVGGESNSSTGRVTSSPYFQFANGSFQRDFPNTLIYDSIVIKYNYDKYYIGDTTKLISFSVKLLDYKQGFNSNGSLYNISAFTANSDGQLYNSSTFKLKAGSLAEPKIYPYPLSKKDFYLHLSDTYGKELFDKILAKNDSLESNQNFPVFMPGVAFISSPDVNNTAVGIAQSSLSLRVYYHQLINPIEISNKTYFNFPVNTSGLWFNQILYNSQGSMLGNISQIRNNITGNAEISSANTYNQTMVQAGSALYTKIRIPGIQQFRGYAKNLVLINARIQLVPNPGSYSITNPLPDSLAVYVVDRRNVISSQLATSTGGNIFALKYVPIASDEQPYYVLDVTSFFESESAAQKTTGNALMIGMLSNKVGQTLNHFSFFGNSNNRSLFKMNIYCYVDKSN